MVTIQQRSKCRCMCIIIGSLH